MGLRDGGGYGGVDGASLDIKKESGLVYGSVVGVGAVDTDDILFYSKVSEWIKLSFPIFSLIR